MSDAPLGTPGRLRLMAIHAHPDDEASKGAATTAMYAAAGADVLVVTCTGGERGDVLNSHFAPPNGMGFESLEQRRAVRQIEMANAAAALGVSQHFLGWTDSGYAELADGYAARAAAKGLTLSDAVDDHHDWTPPLPQDAFALVPLQEAAAPLVEAIRRFRPHVVTTYDPDGGYPHPDHIRTHTVTMEAWDAAGDGARYVVEGGAEPWTPLKLYYNHGFSNERLTVVHEAMIARGLESPFAGWLADRAAGKARPEREGTTRIRSVAYFPARDDALRAHASQIDPDGWFFAVPRDLEAEVWPWDEYELAASRVALPQPAPNSGAPETDLFAGITGVEADE